jgi:hypothetical protein
MFLGTKQFYKGYDPGAAYFYGRLGDASGQPVQGRNGVETAGASTTVTATDGTPFDPVTVGSIIVFCSPRPDGKIVRTVTAKASGSSITVDSAVTLGAGTAFFFWPFKGGTTDSDGWHNVNAFSAITVFVDVATLGSTAIEAIVEVGGGPFSAPVQANTTPAAVSATVTASISAVGRVAIEVFSVAQSLRVGLRVTGGPAADAVSVWLAGEMLQAK